MSTADHKAAMWAGKSNVMVVVRCRPITTKERRGGQWDLIKVLDGKMVVVSDPASVSDDILRQHRSRDRKYAFDHAFGPETTQESLYERTTQFLINGVVSGFNATVFAYGATGAGKTFTMLGTRENPGIMILTLRDLFARISTLSEGGSLIFNVTMSYVEVYNENIRDLLVGSDESLELREDPIKGPTVAGVTSVSATNTEEIMSMLAKGNKFRRQEPTAANKESSRSHAVLQIFVEQKERNGTATKVGKLSLIDLAGSERASNTQNKGIRLKEGANINRSLLALGNCINALGSGAKGSFVPYRDSKLTRLLKDSLGGNCRTVMIANIAPNSSAFEETLNTLKYANRAKNIKTSVSRNVLSVNYHISEYENLIAGLRSEISELKDQLSVHGGAPSSALLATRPLVSASGEQATVDRMRDLLIQNFQERMQLRRSIIELQAQNVQNNAEISRWRVEIARCEDMTRQGEGASPLHLTAMPAALHLQIARAAAAPVHTDGTVEAKDGDGKDGAIEPEEVGEKEVESGAKPAESAVAGAGGMSSGMPKGDLVGDGASRAPPPKLALSAADANSYSALGTTSSTLGDVGCEPDNAPKTVGEAIERAANARREVQELEASIAENKKARDGLIERLRQNAEQADALHADLASKITSEGVKELLELEYRVGVLELENMELEHARMVHEQYVRQKDIQLRKCKLQMRARDRLILEQQRVLEEHGLGHLVSKEALQRLDEQLALEVEEHEGTTETDSETFNFVKEAPFLFKTARAKLEARVADGAANAGAGGPNDKGAKLPTALPMPRYGSARGLLTAGAGVDPTPVVARGSAPSRAESVQPERKPADPVKFPPLVSVTPELEPSPAMHLPRDPSPVRIEPRGHHGHHHHPRRRGHASAAARNGLPPRDDRESHRDLHPDRVATPPASPIPMGDERPGGFERRHAGHASHRRLVQEHKRDRRSMSPKSVKSHYSLRAAAAADNGARRASDPSKGFSAAGRARQRSRSRSRSRSKSRARRGDRAPDRGARKHRARRHAHAGSEGAEQKSYRFLAVYSESPKPDNAGGRNRRHNHAWKGGQAAPSGPVVVHSSGERGAQAHPPSRLRRVAEVAQRPARRLSPAVAVSDSASTEDLWEAGGLKDEPSPEAAANPRVSALAEAKGNPLGRLNSRLRIGEVPDGPTEYDGSPGGPGHPVDIAGAAPERLAAHHPRSPHVPTPPALPSSPHVATSPSGLALQGVGLASDAANQGSSSPVPYRRRGPSKPVVPSGIFRPASATVIADGTSPAAVPAPPLA